MKVGVLGFQGGVYEQVYALKRASEELGLNCKVESVVEPREILESDALVLPGGESTTMLKVASRLGVWDIVKERVGEGVPLLGVCAGTILMARKVTDYHTGKVLKGVLGVMNIDVVRNYYGRQRESFEVDVEIPELGGKPYRCIFIRAPAITRVDPPAKKLAVYEDVTIAAVEDCRLAVTFHPELSGDTRLYKYFLRMVKS